MTFVIIFISHLFQWREISRRALRRLWRTSW